MAKTFPALLVAILALVAIFAQRDDARAVTKVISGHLAIT